MRQSSVYASKRAGNLRCSIFYDVTRRRLVVTAVSGRPVDPYLQRSSSSSRHWVKRSELNQMNSLHRYIFFNVIAIHSSIIPNLSKWNGTGSISYPLASRQQYLFDICLLLCVQSWTPVDGRKDPPKHVQCHSKIIWYSGASSWFD